MGTPSFGVLVSDRHGGSFGSRRVSFGAEFRIVSFGSGGGQFQGAGGGGGMLRGSDPKLTQGRTRN